MFQIVYITVENHQIFQIVKERDLFKFCIVFTRYIYIRQEKILSGLNWILWRNDSLTQWKYGLKENQAFTIRSYPIFIYNCYYNYAQCTLQAVHKVNTRILYTLNLKISLIFIAHSFSILAGTSCLKGYFNYYCRTCTHDERDKSNGILTILVLKPHNLTCYVKTRTPFDITYENMLKSARTPLN